MDIPIGANVICTDGRLGKSRYVLIDPISKEITHVVVHEKGFLGSKDRLVSLDNISKTTSNEITLNLSKADVFEMDDFNEDYYIDEVLIGEYPLDVEDYFLWPYVTSAYSLSSFILDEEWVVPYDTHDTSVHRGTKIYANNKKKKIGKVDELIVDANTSKITYMVMTEGHLWGKKDISIPASMIDLITDDGIYLNVDQQAVADLPKVSVKRFHKARELATVS